MTRDCLIPWMLDAIKQPGGSATVVGVGRFIWQHQEGELHSAGDLFLK